MSAQNQNQNDKSDKKDTTVCLPDAAAAQGAAHSGEPSASATGTTDTADPQENADTEPRVAIAPKLIVRGVFLAILAGALIYLVARHSGELKRPVTEESFPKVDSLGIPGAEVALDTTAGSTTTPTTTSVSSGPIASTTTPATGTTAARPTSSTVTATTTSRPAGSSSSTTETTRSAAATTPAAATSTQPSTPSAAAAAASATTPALTPTQPVVGANGKPDWKNTVITGPVKNAYIAVFLSRKIVALCVGQEYVRVYRDAGVPADTSKGKMRADDGLAPVGDYYACARKLETDGRARILISYPSPRDAIMAENAGLINAATRRQIESIPAGKVPPQKTAMGGVVCVEATFAPGATTTGSITLDKKSMDELYKATQIGTPIRIRP